MVFSLSLKAQEKLSSYKIDNTNYSVQINVIDSTNYKLYIDMYSLDNIHETVGIMVDTNQRNDLEDAIKKAKLKFIEWKKVAIKNSVKDFNKSMDISVSAGAYFLYGDEWRFQYDINLSFSFMVFESKGRVYYYLVMSTGKLTASDNEYMTVDGAGNLFSTTTEINSFIHSISLDVIKSYLNKPKTEDLFK